MMIALIDHRATSDRRFQASLHGMSLKGDAVTEGRPHNSSHAAMLRMKERRRLRGGV